MLETRIEELTAAVKSLTEMMSVRITSQPAPEVVKEPKAKKETKIISEGTVLKTIMGEKTFAEHDAEIPNDQQPTTTDTSPPSESESAPVTYDDVKKATNALSAAKGRDVTIDALSRFGVKRATELDEGQWVDYIAYTETVIADE